VFLKAINSLATHRISWKHFQTMINYDYDGVEAKQSIPKIRYFLKFKKI
jgi:glutaredoxin-related protein